MRKPASRETSGSSKRIRVDRTISLIEKQHRYTLDREGKAIRKPKCAGLIGSLKGKLKVKGNIFSTGLRWYAER